MHSLTSDLVQISDECARGDLQCVFVQVSCKELDNNSLTYEG